MKCYVTGAETKTKWRNVPITRNSLEAAKKLMAIDAKCTMKQALKQLRDHYGKVLEEKIESKRFEQSLK